MRRANRRADLLDWWSDYSWFLWAGAVLVVFVLGYLGFERHFEETNQERSATDLFYLSLQLFPLGSGDVAGAVPWQLQFARIVAPALALAGLIAAIRALYRAFKQGHWKVQRLSDHVVICGCGRRGSLLAVALRDMGYSVVAIENGGQPEHIERCREKKVVVLSGDATDAALLRKAHVERADHLIALCGADSVNARIAIAASDALRERPNPDLRAHIHISDEELAEMIKRQGGLFADGDIGPFQSLDLIDVFAVGAKAMLDMHPAFIPRDWNPRDRLLVVGLGELGKHLVLEAAEQWKKSGHRSPLKLTVLDRDAREKLSHLKIANPELADSWSAEGWQHDLAGAGFDERAYLTRRKARRVRAVYVCFDDEHLALTTTFRLQHDFDGVPIKARMPQRDEGLAKLLPEDHDVYPFGLIEAACNPDQLLSLHPSAEREVALGDTAAPAADSVAQRHSNADLQR